jgi:fatty-acid desaturase
VASHASRKTVFVGMRPIRDANTSVTLPIGENRKNEWDLECIIVFIPMIIINVCQTFFFNKPQTGCPRLVLATTCLLPASAGIIITLHRYLLR